VRDGGAGIKIRIVKGANLAMESVEAELHDWPCAVVSDQGGGGCELQAHAPRRLPQGERGTCGSAWPATTCSIIAYAMLLRAREGVEDRVDFEMLEGMANHQARVVHEVGRRPDLLYAPVVNHDDFHSAIAYLVRRLDENTADENFLHDCSA
jgi:RHH-type transcriptional regulator, proline utilization regulon repressor / proline dehydrogenase / delta 1-pyrroline-5-carboxylate dehydrogenase